MIPAAFISDFKITEGSRSTTATITWTAPLAEAVQAVAPAWRPKKGLTRFIDSMGWGAGTKYDSLVCRSFEIDDVAGPKGSMVGVGADHCSFKASYSTAEWIDSAPKYSQEPITEFLQLTTGFELEDGTVVTEPIYVPLGSRKVTVERVYVYDSTLVEKLSSVSDKLNKDTIGIYQFSKGQLYLNSPRMSPTRHDYERNLDIATVTFEFVYHPQDHNKFFDTADHTWKWLSPTPFAYADMSWIWNT